jgi:hypothetical protein
MTTETHEMTDGLYRTFYVTRERVVSQTYAIECCACSALEAMAQADEEDCGWEVDSQTTEWEYIVVERDDPNAPVLRLPAAEQRYLSQCLIQAAELRRAREPVMAPLLLPEGLDQ